MKHSIHLQTGPFCFRIGSDWRLPITQLAEFYTRYPTPTELIPHFTVRLEAANFWRKYLRPAVTLMGDHMLPGALPLPLTQALLAAEMGMNLQLALGCRKFLLLHAASVARDGKVLILTGESGSGKSTLAALLSNRGWRLLGDEFALIDPVTGLAWPFPRPISLKNASIAVVEAEMPSSRFGPLLTGTPKGDIRHLIPDAEALGAMNMPAQPALLIFPRFGYADAVRPILASEVFMRLTQASTNYVALGERGYQALIQLVTRTPVKAVDFQTSASGLAIIDQLWRDSA